MYVHCISQQNELMRSISMKDIETFGVVAIGRRRSVEAGADGPALAKVPAGAPMFQGAKGIGSPKVHTLKCSGWDDWMMGFTGN